MVSSVTKDAIGLVTVMDDQRHNLETGDVVTFNSVQGMTEVGKAVLCGCHVLLLGKSFGFFCASKAFAFAHVWLLRMYQIRFKCSLIFARVVRATEVFSMR